MSPIRPRLRTTATALAATSLLAGILTVGQALPANADSSYCGFTIDTIQPGDDPIGAFDQEARGFYDDHIAQLHQQFPGVSQTDFCDAAWRLIDEGSQAIVYGAIRDVVAGNALTAEQRRTFDRAFGRAVDDATPSIIPAVGSTGATTGVHVANAHLGGTWAYTDTNDGSWHDANDQPANTAYWFANGLGLGVDCQVVGAPYNVLNDGITQTWSTYLHVTDGTFVRSAAVSETTTDDGLGLPTC